MIFQEIQVFAIGRQVKSASGKLWTFKLCRVTAENFFQSEKAREM